MTLSETDYWKAKAALLDALLTQQKAEAATVRAWQQAQQRLLGVGVPAAPSYSWDDATLTITPHPVGG